MEQQNIIPCAGKAAAGNIKRPADWRLQLSFLLYSLACVPYDSGILSPFPKGEEFPGQHSWGEGAASDTLLLSSRYEEERLKARRERSVPSGCVRAGAELGPSWGDWWLQFNKNPRHTCTWLKALSDWGSNPGSPTIVTVPLGK